ncbi:MAG: hypothetical protein P4L46_01205 [Fimbriimonas sp.]|nr:hypothetical protein [Fimbriimonas sp.]
MEPCELRTTIPPYDHGTANGTWDRGPLRVLVGLERPSERDVLLCHLQRRAHRYFALTRPVEVPAALYLLRPGIAIVDRIEMVGPIRRVNNFSDIPIFMIVDGDDDDSPGEAYPGVDMCLGRPVDFSFL